MSAVLALLSALVWGVADFVGGLASRRSTPWQTLVLTTPAGFVGILPIALLVGGTATGSAWPGIAAGVCGGLGILLLYAALTIGPMGVVSPISAVLGAAIPVIVGLLQGERPGAAAYAGMALAVVAIVTVGLEPTSPTDDSAHQKLSPRALLLAIGAGAGIGLFFAFLSYAPTDSGLWPVVFARGTSTVLLVTIGVAVALRSGAPVLPTTTPVRWQAVLAGVLDVGANGFYVLALQTGLLSVVAVLGSLYPAATVLLARLILAERLRPMQKVGMVTALVASALLALG
ncbi:MAG: DMT family transporter [Candidatus Nanopelagicales bacterium]